MSCNITSGISLGCRDLVGGIDTIYIANLPTYDEIVQDVNGLVTSFDLSGSPVSITFYQFEVPRNTSSLTETINASIENGTVFYDQAVTMIFNKLQASTRDQIMLLAQNPKLLVVVKDNNGKYFIVGAQKGAYLTAGTSTTGTALGDRAGYELTITGQETASVYEAAASFIA